MYRALPIVLAALIIGVPHAAARQQEDDRISRRLVALLFPGVADTIVEGLSDEFPADIVPDDATPLVSMDAFGGVTAVVEVPVFTAMERARYERKLAAAGWKLGDGPRGGGVGLMASEVSVPKMYCRDDQMLQFSTQPQARGRSVIRLHAAKARGYGICADADDPRRPRTVFDETTLPPMPPPPGSRSMGSSGGGTSDSMAQTIRLDTTLSAADVEAHYTTILTGHGWTMQSRISGDGMSTARLLPAPADKRAEGSHVGTLEALSLPGGDVFVTLRVIGPRQ